MLETIGKILKRLIYVQLELHFEQEYKSLSNNQFGFRKQKSNIDEIKRLTDSANKALEETCCMYVTHIIALEWLVRQH